MFTISGTVRILFVKRNAAMTESLGFSIYLKQFPVLQLNVRLGLSLLQVNECNQLTLNDLLLY
jgi:hypothetical protein